MTFREDSKWNRSVHKIINFGTMQKTHESIPSSWERASVSPPAHSVGKNTSGVLDGPVFIYGEGKEKREKETGKHLGKKLIRKKEERKKSKKWTTKPFTHDSRNRLGHTPHKCAIQVPPPLKNKALWVRETSYRHRTLIPTTSLKPISWLFPIT